MESKLAFAPTEHCERGNRCTSLRPGASTHTPTSVARSPESPMTSSLTRWSYCVVEYILQAARDSPPVHCDFFSEKNKMHARDFLRFPPSSKIRQEQAPRVSSSGLRQAKTRWRGASPCSQPPTYPPGRSATLGPQKMCSIENREGAFLLVGRSKRQGQESLSLPGRVAERSSAETDR